MINNDQPSSTARLEKELQRKELLLCALRKDLQDAQRQLLQAEKMASVGQLAAGVAHEINNPIGFVSSNIATLRDYIAAYQQLMAKIMAAFEDDTSSAPALAEVVQKAWAEHDIAFINEDICSLIDESVDGLQRVSEIVNGLRLYSRIDSEDRQWHDVNQCLKTTLSMVNNKLKYICEQTLSLADLPKVYINVGKITQVFTNLLINAGQAIESTEKQGVITISTYLKNGDVHVSIKDSGCGVKREHIDKLFNPFFTTKPEGLGTGLGLSISHGIALEHGGELLVESKENQGTTFTLVLPVDGPEPSATR
ncbi:sensor histidine kinase [Aestuariibacter sp. A3R04]|uniref:sensor histidine kinase n=1 Tax=Aestuariibacter sp. A3R04 TaxID=2841571 RepID=UPI001C0A32D0|nr:ATP-binding protein [Aestuariibacter sp. A3R04]MBU3023453.1 GHKL domain-containing protein [Aestuariibacter sp. A3R04]